uniref:C2H2-type domain-containing protein n=1 Tax=Parascaris equorum TaxID=6256 RepID=A0A914RKN8_PAREQ
MTRTKSFNFIAVELEATRTKGLANDDLLLGVVSRLLCSLCPDEVPLTDQECMRQHFVTRHLDREMGRCRACPEVKSRIDPVAHMKMHSSRVYACEFCGKKGRKHYLKAHIRTHTGEKPFSERGMDDSAANSWQNSTMLLLSELIHIMATLRVRNDVLASLMVPEKVHRISFVGSLLDR